MLRSALHLTFRDFTTFFRSVNGGKNVGAAPERSGALKSLLGEVPENYGVFSISLIPKSTLDIASGCNVLI